MEAGAGRLIGEPIWTGWADSVQLRSASPVHGVRLHFVAPPAGAPAVRAAGSPLAQPVLEAGPGQPPIIARSAWAHGHATPAVAPHFGSVKLAFVHHSEGPNGYGAAEVPAILRSIFVYHRYVRGFWDIGYNFAVDAFGRIWEARAGGIDKPVLGAHAGGYNAVSTGVVVLGSFMGASPSPPALRALERLIAWKLALHGAPARGRVTVAGESRATPSTRRSRPALMYRCRGWRATATATPPTAPATSSTASFPRPGPDRRAGGDSAPAHDHGAPPAAVAPATLSLAGNSASSAGRRSPARRSSSSSSAPAGRSRWPRPRRRRTDPGALS